MFTTCTAISRPTRLPPRRILAGAALLTLSVVWSATASAAVSWHPDLATARRASDTSHRPVLAIFTASWSSSSTTLDRTTLASDEAVALITACFEPVCLDVDANPDATRRLGISRIPTACIMDSQEQVLAKFELPETPAGFVAAAARAVQEAAVASATRSRQDSADVTAARRPFADVPDGGARGLPVFGGDPRNPLHATATGEIRGTVPPGGQAINAVAAKVRMLSDFASSPASSGVNDSIGASFREMSYRDTTVTPPTTATANPAPAPTPAAGRMAAATGAPAPVADARSTTTVAATPALPAPPATAAGSQMPATTLATTAPPAAVPASAAPADTSPLAGTMTQKPLSIEPSAAPPTPATGRAAPWLGLPQREQVAATPPQPAAPAAAIPPTASQPLAAAPPTGQAQPSKPATDRAASALADTKPQKPTTSASSSLLSTLQKPFTMFAKPSAPKPTGPRAEPTPTAPAGADTAATAAAEPDAYGSMPVGLEGYCPVTLAERGVWVEGRAQWGVRHRGRTYLFASAEQQKAFLADPDRYAPVLAGDDPVLAMDAGKCTPGQRRYGVTYQSRTYLFSSAETRDTFAANPQRYTTGALVAENRTPGSGPAIR